MTERVQQLVAEFVGAFALIFIGAGAVVIMSLAGIDGGAIVAIALAHGLVIAVMVTAVGHISGGHFNPAVTIAIWVAGKIESSRAALYILVQLLGGIVGGLVLRLALPETAWGSSHLGVPQLARTGGIGPSKGILIEAVLTFFLVFVVFAVAVDDRGAFGKVAGLPIGFVIAFDILMGGAFTGAAMNPARALGPEVAAGFFDDWWVYWVGPVAGGVVAALVYWFVFLRERAPVSGPPTEHPIGGPDPAEWN